MKFEDLGLSPDVLRALEDSGYSDPTPIQAQAIPAVLASRDVLGIAQTGTGKTAAFTLPILTILAHGRARARIPRSLILCPTRELAAQVAASFETYGKYHKLTMALLIGGVSFAEQNARIDRGADVLIATPGRLLDHFERGRLMLTGVQICVIDEADRMLDMGFIPDVERIVRLLPFSRQTMLFSATMPREIAKLAEEFLQGALRVEIAPPATTVESVRQCVVRLASKSRDRERVRFSALLSMLRDPELKITNAIVFCNRKSTVQSLHDALRNAKVSVGALHGDIDQHLRMATLDAFRASEFRILVASDVAARGLDIPAVSHVFNFDVPQSPDDYVHRIGRTARAGRSGMAITLCDAKEWNILSQIERRLRTSFELLRSEPLAPPDREAPRRAPGRSRKSSSRKSQAEEAANSEPESTLAECKQVPTRRTGAKQPERIEESVDSDKSVLTFGDMAPAFLLQGRKTSRSRDKGEA